MGEGATEAGEVGSLIGWSWHLFLDSKKTPEMIDREPTNRERNKKMVIWSSCW